MAVSRKKAFKQKTAKRPVNKKTASGKGRPKKSQGLTFESEVALWILLAVSILFFVSNFGIGGRFGAAASAALFGLFGLMAYVFPVILFIGSCFLISNRRNHFAVFKFVAGILLFCALCLFLQLIISDADTAASQTLKGAYLYSSAGKTGGGALGGLFAGLFVPNFGLFGSYVIAFAVMIISVVLITERSVFRGVKRGGQKVYETAREDAARYRDNQQRRQEARRLRRMDRKVEGVAMDTEIKGKKKPAGDEVSEIMPDEKEAPLPELYIEPVEEEPKETPLPKLYIEPVEEELKEAPPEYEDARLLESLLSDAGSMVEQKPKEQNTKRERAVRTEIKAPERPYVFPDISLLKKGKSGTIGDSRTHLMATANKLQQTLKNFGVNVTITNVSSGPSVTRYEIQPEMGVKVSKIVNLTDDIKLNLAAADIRMEAPIPGKAAIGIEIPNKENVTVMFRDLIESGEFQKNASNLAFAAGKDIGGQVVVADIAKMPHVLIAGATGSGKSVCINTIIMSILYKAHPDDVKLIMVDPKVVELSVYNGIPHLMIPVVTDPKKAAGALNWAVAEMDERYRKFAEYGVRDLKGYNEKAASVSGPGEEDAPRKLPQIVIIVDELADLMMVASHEVENAICRLAQLARAAGLHLIIATQRPSVNVITGLIKANMPSRIAFAVTSGVDSRTILDMVGAEKLLGKGDMLFFPQNYQKPLRVQGAFVSDKEVSDVVDFLKKENSAAEYNPKIQEKMEQSENIAMSVSEGAGVSDEKDVLFQEVGKFLIESEKGSIGSIQRKFKVGFNRAARIMDQLEEAGLVGPEEGTKPRKVLMSLEEFEQYLETCV